MTTGAPSPTELIEVWEAIREHTLTAARDVQRQITERMALRWKQYPPRERGVVAVAVMLGIDPQPSASRRHAREQLQSARAAREVGAVREEPMPPLPTGEPTQIEDILRDVEWIESPGFLEELAKQSGPITAVAWLEKSTRQLKGIRAARFLYEIAYPVAVPTRARLRWLHRIGWQDDPKDTVKNRRRALQLLDELATVCNLDPLEVETILAAFCGDGSAEAKPAGRCEAKPKCAECPVQTMCPEGRSATTSAAKSEPEAAPPRTLRDTYLPEDMPREKLLRLGPENLTDAELLAILIRTGTKRLNVVQLATELLRKAESLDRLARHSVPELARFEGLGPTRAITIRAALELARRLADRPKDEAKVFSNARAVFESLKDYYLNRHKEVFIALNLNTKNHLIRRIVVSEGTLNQSLVHPREAFQEALRDSANAIIFAHNHPSGDVTPSRADRTLTRQLAEAGRILGIRVLDHVIIGRDTYFSFADDPASTELE